MPGSNRRMLEKAPALGADVVMLDLEDAVAPDDKVQARAQVIEALRDLDWSGCSVSLRINGLDTHWCYRDVVDVVEQAGGRLDTILIPKVSCAGDVHLVATLLSQIEAAMRLPHPIGISVLIETAAGHAPRRRDRRRLPRADGGDGVRRRRLRRLAAEPHDVDRRLHVRVLRAHRGGRASTGATSGTTRSRASPWRAGRTGCARSTGPTATSATPRATARRRGGPRCSGTRASGRSTRPRSRSPTTVFTPDAAAAEKTRRIVAAMAEAAREGRGAVSLDGRLIDAASLRMAETLLHKLEQIEAREAAAPALVVAG